LSNVLGSNTVHLVGNHWFGKENYSRERATRMKAQGKVCSQNREEPGVAGVEWYGGEGTREEEEMADHVGVCRSLLKRQGNLEGSE
jgi:hypothetical protein